jgi:hypothetical protein
MTPISHALPADPPPTEDQRLLGVRGHPPYGVDLPLILVAPRLVAVPGRVDRGDREPGAGAVTRPVSHHCPAGLRDEPWRYLCGPPAPPIRSGGTPSVPDSGDQKTPLISRPSDRSRPLGRQHAGDAVPSRITPVAM